MVNTINSDPNDLDLIPAEVAAGRYLAKKKIPWSFR